MTRKPDGSPLRVKVVRLPHGGDLPCPPISRRVQPAWTCSLPSTKALTLKPGARALVPTGLILEMPHGFEAQVRPRSGLALQATASPCSISPGTIDSDYRGEVQVLLINLGDKPFRHRAAASASPSSSCNALNAPGSAKP